MTRSGVIIGWLFITLSPSIVASDPPGVSWPSIDPRQVGLDPDQLAKARDYAMTGGGSGMITRHGKLVLSWGDQEKQYDLKSTTKSFGATALGIAIHDGKVRLDAPAGQYHQFFREDESRRGITIFQLATHTAGFEKPGGSQQLLDAPGTKWSYSDSGPNWLAECLTLVYRRDLDELMFERVFQPIGIDRDDLRWRRNQYRPHKIDGIERREFGSGIHANVDAMARLGFLHLQNGRWGDHQIIAKEFVQRVSRPQENVVGLPNRRADEFGNASDHYGLLWWNNADKTLPNVPADAYWSWGLYDSIILVIPSLDMVVARAGKSWKREGGGHYKPLAGFMGPICAAVRDPDVSRDAARRIREIRWSPSGTVLRRANGSDNWPLTWGDDGAMYTAYGDGWGFEPKVKKKLSLGFAKVIGGPAEPRGINIRSESGEHLGDGKEGRKASGMLMVDGVLYVWTRNVGLSQLGWSRDRGVTWKWTDWKFDAHIAAPTFLTFGQDYKGAIDAYVYVYSFDSKNAYDAGDRMILARVPKRRIAERNAYEFFVGLGRDTSAVWTDDIGRIGAVFEEAGGCFRSHVSYNAGIDRFLWVQVKGTNDTRFRGGLAVFEAKRPWGPWYEAYRATPWDIGPGDSASFPTKWMSNDGRTIHLVFSGDDCFSVRQATLLTND